MMSNTPAFPDLTHIEVVRTEILAAFRDVPLPDVEAILGPAVNARHAPWVNVQGDSKRLKIALARKSYDEVTSVYTRKLCGSFNLLSAEAYHYYIQSLLFGVLDNMHDVDFVTQVLAALHPEDHDLYYYGQDTNFEYLISLFTPEQLAAVCSFLGLMLTTDHAGMSATVLRWGWVRIEHPAIKASLPYYPTQKHFIYPPADEPKRAELIEHIRSAFDATPYPGDGRIVDPPNPDRYRDDEPLGIALAFRGLDWRTIDPEILADCYSSLSFFSDEAFRYYLPAYLIANVHDSELIDTGNAAPVFHLTFGFSMKGSELGWRPHTIKRLNGFSKVEREAIIAYLRYYAADLDPYDSCRFDIEEALNSYWLKTV
jgi:hypothetical protein